MSKKRIVSTCTILILFFSIPAVAQDAFGIFGGYNITNMIREPARLSSAHEQRPRLLFGGLVEFSLMQNFALHLEPMYVQKGAHFDFIDTAGDARRDRVDLGYLEIPILAKYRILASKTSPYILAGPSVAWLLSAKQGNRSSIDDIKDQRKSLDIGIGGGAGIFLTSDRLKIFIEARYNYGLTNIDDTSEDNSTLRNNGFRFFLGVLFPSLLFLLGGFERSEDLIATLAALFISTASGFE